MKNIHLYQTYCNIVFVILYYVLVFTSCFFAVHRQ